MAKKKKTDALTEEVVSQESGSKSGGAKASGTGTAGSSASKGAGKGASITTEGSTASKTETSTAVDGSTSVDMESGAGVDMEMDTAAGVTTEAYAPDTAALYTLAEEVSGTEAAAEMAEEIAASQTFSLAPEAAADAQSTAVDTNTTNSEIQSGSSGSSTATTVTPTVSTTTAGASVSSKTDAESALSDYYYTQSEAVLAANAALADYLNNAPDEYTSSYQEQIDALLDQILNREDFSYDFDADPLYQQYKNQYEHSAMLAMQDTMAQAQSATGGYGSSYAVQAASGAYQGEINQITEAMPELYTLAYDLYSDKGDTMITNLNELSDQEKMAQDLYQDLLANYYTGLESYTEAAENAYAKDYQQYEGSLSYLQELLGYYAGQEQQSFENSQAQLAYELAVKEYEESIRQWETELSIQQSQWQAEFDAAQAAAEAAAAAAASKVSSYSTSSSSGSSSSGSSSSSSSASSTSNASTTTLSETASALKTTIVQEMRNYAASSNGVTTADINAEATSIIASYYRTGLITKDEANALGASYGATF